MRRALEGRAAGRVERRTFDELDRRTPLLEGCMLRRGVTLRRTAGRAVRDRTELGRLARVFGRIVACPRLEELDRTVRCGRGRIDESLELEIERRTPVLRDKVGRELRLDELVTPELEKRFGVSR